MKRIFIVVLFFSGLLSCLSRQETSAERTSRLVRFFNENEIEFEELRGYLEVEYLRISKSRKVGLKFFNCHVTRKILPSEVCDERVIDYLEDLKLRTIAAYDDLDCAEKWLDETWFYLDENKGPTAAFAYSACGSGLTYESPSIKYYPINRHWALQFEY